MATKKAVEEVDVVEILEPKIQDYVFVLGEGGSDPITFVQKPLGFMGKIKLFSVLSKTISKVLDEGVSLDQLLDTPESGSLPLSGDASLDAEVFIKTITKVLKHAPEMLGDVFCVILNVPSSQQEYVTQRLNEDLTDEQGFAILNTFVDQNWEILFDFFTGKTLPLWNKISQKLQG